MAKKVYFDIVFVISVILNNSSANTCNQDGPCMCKFDEYTQLNLTQLLPSDTKFIEDSLRNYTYFFSGCKDTEFNAQDYKLNSTQKFPASLVKCIAIYNTYIIYNTTINATYMEHNCTAIGMAKQITYVSTSGDSIVYKVKEGSPPSIQLVCVNSIRTDLKIANYDSDELILYSPGVCVKHISHHELSTGSIFCILFFTAAIIYFVGGGLIMYTARGARGIEVIPNFDFWISLPGLMKELILYSPGVCVKHISHHELSTGSIFCILFFTAAIIYFVGGGLIMYTARGARGIEVIPNFDFWISLPGLMKDGMIFILSGCRPFTVATAETYDRI